MSSGETEELHLDGFVLAAFSVRRQFMHGGTAIFVKDTLATDVENVMVDFNIEKCIECSIIYIRNFNLYILVFYRSPSGDFDTFLSVVESTFNRISVNKSVIVAGDFNVHFNTNEKNTTDLCDIGLHQKM